MTFAGISKISGRQDENNRRVKDEESGWSDQKLCWRQFMMAVAHISLYL